MSAESSRRSRAEKVAATKAEHARRQRQRKLLIALAVLVVVVVVAVAILWNVSQRQSSKADATAQSSAKDTAFITDVTSVPASAFDAVGVGAARSAPTPIPGASPMSEDGKPRVLYVGAEFCPYCAMERWALVAALSRFGTFTGLKGGVSSSDEGQLSNIQTLSFLDVGYTSDVVALQTYETTDRNHQPLQKLSAADNALFTKYNPQGGIPWIDWGGTSQSGVAYDGSILVGKTNTEIGKALSQPSSPIAQGVLGAANVASAQICTLTKGQPVKVCDSAGVKTAAAAMPK